MSFNNHDYEEKRHEKNIPDKLITSVLNKKTAWNLKSALISAAEARQKIKDMQMHKLQAQVSDLDTRIKAAAALEQSQIVYHLTPQNILTSEVIALLREEGYHVEPKYKHDDFDIIVAYIISW